MSLFIAPLPRKPSLRQRLIFRWNAWRWRKHGGLSPRWKDVGFYEPEPR